MKVTYKYQCRTDRWVAHYIKLIDGKPTQFFVVDDTYRFAGYLLWKSYTSNISVSNTAVDATEEDIILEMI